MAVNVTTAFNGTQTALEVVQAYVENQLVPDSCFIRSVGKEAQTVFPTLSARTPSNSADGAAIIAAGGSGGATETAVTLSADNPLKSQVMIPFSAINTSPVNFTASYTQRLGADLRDAHDKRLTNFGVATAIATGTSVVYDNELASGSALAAAIATVVSTLDGLKVPQDNRVLFVKPSELIKLYDQQTVANSQWTGKPGNETNRIRYNWLGLDIISGVFNFGVNSSADTSYDTKYRVNMATTAGQEYLGICWQKNALAVQYFEDINVKSSMQELYESYMVAARVQFGTAALRPTNFVTLRGDV